MTTLTAERRELQREIDTLPDDGVMAMLGFLKSLRRSPDNDDGFYDPANIRRLEHSLEQAKQGKIVVKTIEELECMANE
jgi:hypothetical protein